MDAPAAPVYRRLPGRAAWFRLGAKSALWLGPDHLLKIDRIASRETYKRFYYWDIQAIVVEESSRRFSVTMFDIPVIGVIFLLTLLFSKSTISSLPLALLLASPVIVGLVVNLALGRTSQAHLVTAVGTESLSSLSRLERAALALRQIGDEVTKTQGEVSTEQLLMKWPAAIATPPVD